MIKKSDRRTFLKLSTGAGALALGGLARHRRRAEPPPTLTVAWDTDIDSLDPHVFKSVGGYGVQCNLYDPITSLEGAAGRRRGRPVALLSPTSSKAASRSRGRSSATAPRSC